MEARNRADYTIAWITDEEGQKAAWRHSQGQNPQPEPKDFARSDTDLNQYTWGQLGCHNDVVVVPPKKVSATQTVQALLAAVPDVRFGLFVGTAALNPERAKEADIRLGDLMISEPGKAPGGVFQYDSETAKSQQRVSHEGFPGNPREILTDSLQSFMSNWAMEAQNLAKVLCNHTPAGDTGEDRLFEPSYVHVDGTNCLNCDQEKLVQRRQRGLEGQLLHSGFVSSSKDAVSDPETRQNVEEYIGAERLCFDTTSADLMGKFPSLMVKGVSRYADSHKNSIEWYYYASAVAAAFANSYLKSLSASEINNMAKAASICGSKPLSQSPVESD